MLIQVVTFYIENKKHIHSETLASANIDKQFQIAPASEWNEFSGLKFKIPAACTSLLDSCKLIKNDYSLRLKVDTGTLSSSASYIMIPIEIGSVPIVQPDAAGISDKLSVVYQPIKSRGKNNDGEIKLNNIINFFDPLYPVFIENQAR